MYTRISRRMRIALVDYLLQRVEGFQDHSSAEAELLLGLANGFAANSGKNDTKEAVKLMYTISVARRVNYYKLGYAMAIIQCTPYDHDDMCIFTRNLFKDIRIATVYDAMRSYIEAIK